jgi:asparagine synthase (glutamine-hydrolysing)
MCGIAGFFEYDHRGHAPSEAELLLIRDAMAQRGPDGAGLWIAANRRVGLAHRRLSILDVSDNAAQPMFTADNQLGIVFNGEIYNFKSLRNRMLAKGHRFRSTGDTEVLLALYREYGEEMLLHLRGMFAFALFDAKRRTLLLARDPLGIKPLYFSQAHGVVTFASQVKALLASPAVDRTPDPAAHAGFYLWGNVPEPYTLYRGVRSLPAGHCMTLKLDGGEPRVRCYAHLVDELVDGTTRAQYPATKPDKVILHDALRETVEQHMVSDVPVAVFLSAGLDSATTLALMSELPGVQIRSLTLGFDTMRNTPLDETPIAETLARIYGAEHRSYFVGREVFQQERAHLLHAMDQPTVDGVNTYFVSRMSKQAGFKVALSGLGGDELFAGYPSYIQVPRIVESLSTVGSLPVVGKLWRIVTAQAMKRMTSPKYAGLLEYGGSYPGAYLLRRGLYMPWELPSVMDPDMAAQGLRELHPLLSMKETLRPFQNMTGPAASRLRVTALEMSMYMRQQLLRDADWAGMAHSVEIRTPFVDFQLLHDLAPLLAGPNPPGKQQMAACPARALPRDVLDRPKTGFGVPVREWLMSGASPRPGQWMDRGLRGWSRLILDHFLTTDPQPLCPSSLSHIPASQASLP